MLLRPAALILPLLLALSGCGGGDDGPGDGRLQVAAAFYPLQWVTAQVAGDRATVDSLTPPGAEPHDLELGPRDVVALGEADLVVYLDGFQPSVDQAVDQEAGDSALDVRAAARLDLPGEEGSGADPHFWLDPTRLADVADTVAARLAETDPGHAAGYRARAAQVRADLEALDQEMTTGLTGCAGADLVTNHRAFGYLAERYDLRQLGISGVSPESEPSPADLATVAAFVEEHDVRTIFTETLVSPEIADTVARETGAATAVLDPLEGLTDESAGDDYLSVMRSNLQTLRGGLGCDE
jgi:zinc transport system substrate-binding protein